jgi:multiple sugar transport system permease protein
MKLSKLLIYLFSAILVLYVLIPLMMAITLSLNPDNTEIQQIMGTWRGFIPTRFSLDNFIEIWNNPQHPFFRYLLNTAIITLSTLVLSIFLSSMAAFALAWGESKMRKYLLLLVIGVLAIPSEALVIPQLLMVSRANLIDTYLVQILPVAVSAFYIFLFYQFFSKIPKDLIDAAKVDGFNLFQTYRHIGMPSSKPVTVTVAVLHFLAIWNAYLWPIMVTRGTEVRPLSVAMASFFGSNQSFMGNVMAFAVCMAVPVIIFFLFIQKHFVTSITGSSVKG